MLWGSVPSYSLNARTLVVCLGLTVAVVFPLHGGGTAESRLAPAERLLEQQEYSKALLLLAQIQRQNPDLSEETSRLISQVIIVRGEEYNRVFEELLHALFVEEDDDKSLNLIAQLQKIDPVSAGGEAAFGTDFVKLLRLLKDANARLAAGRIVDALSLYILPIADPARAGFDMQRPQFQAAGYGPLVTNSVNEAVAQLQVVVGQQVKGAQAIASVSAGAAAFLKGPANARSPEAFDSLSAPLLQAARSEQAVRRIGAVFQLMNRNIGEGSDKPKSDPYLRYLGWLCLGRENKVEGMAYAMRRLWEERAQEVEDRASESAAKSFQAARSLFDAGSLDPADAAFAEAGYRGIIAVKAAALAGSEQGGTIARGGVLPPEREKMLLAHLSRASAAQEMTAEAEAFRKLIGYRRELGSLPAASAQANADPARADAEKARLISARATLDARSQDARAEQDAWRSRSIAWAARVATGADVMPLSRSAQGIADLYGAFADTDLRQRDLAYAVRLARIAVAGFPGRLEGAVALRKQGQDIKNGTKNGEIPTAQEGLLTKLPEKARPLFENAASQLDGLIADIGGLEQDLTKEKQYVVSSAEMREVLKGSRGLEQTLASAQAERLALDNLLLDIQRQIEESLLASREGDNLYALAESAYKKGDTESAASNADRSLDKYIESQTIAWSEHAVTRSDKDIPELQRLIAEQRNKIAIGNAAKAIAAIKARFEAKDYLGANDLLDAAERTWGQTQKGSYPLFDNLRQNIQTALDLSAGRDISRLDPKADVIYTFIRYAQDSLAAGKLKEAAANVKDALAVAPNYGAAKVLDLKIKKQTDPAGFKTEAAEQIASFVNMAKDPARQKTAYLALLDYASLDPAFKVQLKDVMLELEYSLGITPRPATPQQVAQYGTLVRQANQVQQAGTPEAYQQALDLLKQALKINTDNTAAIRLDAEIRGKVILLKPFTLSDADLKMLKKAQSLYISGAYQDSYDIVLELYNDPRSPRNKSYDQLLKLKKRCEVALNIQ
jgi:hypothetical protein